MIIALSLWAWPAHAQKSKAELTAQYDKAQKHYLDKQFTEALPLFEEVSRDLGSPNAQLYVGRCLTALGRHLEAREQMMRAIEMADNHPDASKYADTRNNATSELAVIETKLARIMVKLHEPPAGLRVEVAGKPVDPAALDKPVFVTPGKVRIDGIAPGRELVRVEVDARDNITESVALVFPKPPPPPTATPAVVTPPPAPLAPTAPPPAALPPDDSAISGVQIGGIVIGSLGLVAFAVAAGAGLGSNAIFDDLDRECDTRNCGNEIDDDVDAGQFLEVLANTMIGVGAVTTTAGLLMIILGGSGSGDGPIGEVSSHGGWLGYRIGF